MRIFPLGFAIFAIVCPSIPATGAAAAAPAALKTFLEHEGYGGSPLQRRFGNHLFVNTLMNGRRSALMIDTGCPYTLIDRGSAGKIGLAIEESKFSVTNIAGEQRRFGVSKVTTLVMGNCTFKDVPVMVANQKELLTYARPSLDGLFGAHEMSKFGVIIDCTRQMMYVSPRGPSAAASQKLADYLSGRGFTRIPMHFNPGHHLVIDAAINGHPTQLTVDTGAPNTLVSAPVAANDGASLSPRFSYRGEGIGRVNQLTLGNLVVNNAEIEIENVIKQVGPGLLGEEYLSWNFGVVDVGGMNLYLRPPEPKGPGKNR